MIIRLDDIKSVCSDILLAVDSSELSVITETLEMFIKDNNLYLNVTNREYFVSVKIPVNETENFHATINANLFLKLISQTTTETVELNTNDKYLIVKGNGTYKIPLIFDNDKLLELPKININNCTVEFDIDSEILNGILKYNSYEINKSMILLPVQKLYYIDNNGAITFSSGACVNNFTIGTEFKILLNSRIVKLFKLFRSGSVKFNLGYDEITKGLVQTKVEFSNSRVTLTAIISCDDTLLNSVPVTAIRNRANKVYNYSAQINRNNFAQCLKRLQLFFTTDSFNKYITMEFTPKEIIITNESVGVTEKIYYENDTNLTENYLTKFDISDIISVLDNCNENYITISFGDNQAMTISYKNIVHVVPECQED